MNNETESVSIVSDVDSGYNNRRKQQRDQKVYAMFQIDLKNIQEKIALQNIQLQQPQYNNQKEQQHEIDQLQAQNLNALKQLQQLYYQLQIQSSESQLNYKKNFLQDPKNQYNKKVAQQEIQKYKKQIELNSQFIEKTYNYLHLVGERIQVEEYLNDQKQIMDNMEIQQNEYQKQKYVVTDILLKKQALENNICEVIVNEFQKKNDRINLLVTHQVKIKKELEKHLQEIKLIEENQIKLYKQISQLTLLINSEEKASQSLSLGINYNNVKKQQTEARRGLLIDQQESPLQTNQTGSNILSEQISSQISSSQETTKQGIKCQIKSDFNEQIKNKAVFIIALLLFTLIEYFA